MRIALDTTFLAYAEGVDDPARRQTARTIVERLIDQDVVLPTQTIGELYNVLTRKAGINPGDANRRIATWLDGYSTILATERTFRTALELACAHRLQFWDALILVTASEAGCALLLSEDMQDGFVWRGLTVVNPFAEKRHPLLASLTGE
ncbi:MAG: VapC toxin family PIN domain ribonuclease [Rhizobiales bacterium 65-9]|nr:PIN domain-containing protein [Hyphomicrobiales bacterium]OJY35052.1 MAG: VapC toxin family PIN domain ribonuclease [Rhizobiales bacterium 65-9]